MKHLCFLLALCRLPNWASSTPIQSRDECPAIPTTSTSSYTSKLPNPFAFFSGANVTTRSQWSCRRSEIRKLLLETEYGPLPPALPRSNISATFTPGTSDKGTITITITGAAKTISFAPKIAFPAEGNGTKPYPVVIAYGGSSIPLPSYAAVITYNNNDVASSQQRSGGKFYDAYPSYRSTTGGFAGAAWGLSRIVDALEILKDKSELNIDVGKIAITGCSINGRNALVGSALEDRIALTIAQESGEGGDNCWRIREAEKPTGKVIYACDPVVECPPDWTPYAPSFSANVMGSKVYGLPVDQHFLASLIAPRGLLVLSADIDWLKPVAGLGCMGAARTVWDALGEKGNIGWSLQGGHAHCQFPVDKQGTELEAFFEKFLRDRKGTLDVWRSSPEVRTNLGNWVTWNTPDLKEDI